MYEQYFGLKKTPFRLESEPDMFFMGENQKRILNAVSDALKNKKGIITLSGLPGTGKTTIVRQSVETSLAQGTLICRVNRGNVDNAIKAIKSELVQRFQSTYGKDSQKIDIEKIISAANREKKRVLIIIDEAQQLSSDEIQSLFNIVLTKRSFECGFQFLLVGHEDLNELFNLDQYDGQNTSVSLHNFLVPLKQTEISAYVHHRLKVAGWDGNPKFDESIYDLIFRITKGVPRRLNSFFDRLLLFSYLESAGHVDDSLLLEFCAELYEELENEVHPDLDSHDLRQALRCEKKEFESAIPSKPPVEEVPEKTPASSSVVKLRDHQKPAAKRPKSPEQEKLGELIQLVANFLDNPERFKHYSDEFYQLPKDIGLLLALATEKDSSIEKAIPTELMNLMPLEVRRMIRHFLRRVLITANADPYRILGLPPSANEDKINQHFDYLMRICRSDIGGASEWPKSVESSIKQAYIKILGSNAPGKKKPEAFDDDLATGTTDTTVESLNSNETTSDSSSTPKSLKTESDSSDTPEQSEDTEIDQLTSIPNTQETEKGDADQNSARFLKNTVNIEIEEASKPAESIKAENTNSDSETTEKPHFEVPILKDRPGDSDVSSFEVRTVPKKNKLLPMVAGIVIVGGIAAFFAFTQSNDSSDTKEKLALPEKTPEVNELKLLDKNSLKSQPAATKKSENKDLISKILTPEKKPKTKPKEKPATGKKTDPQKSKPVKKVAEKPARKVNEEKTKVDKKPDSKPKPNKVAKAENTQKAKSNDNSPGSGANKPSKNKPNKPEKSSVANAKPAAAAASVAPATAAASTTSTTPAPEGDPDNSGGNFFAINNADLSRLMFYFKRSYESGDIDIFGSLFADDAITNENSNRAQIIRDYKSLFDVTQKREIQLKNISWNKESNTATGNGTFVLSILEKEGVETEEIRGEISIKAEKINHKAKIKELFYRYSFAAN